MEKNKEIEKELLAYRQQIDAIDDKLIALMIERIGIVGKVGEYKRKTAAGRCPIRPAREAEMLRRVAEEFKGTSFPPVAAAAMWRIIIGASTSAEGDMSLSVYAPDRENDLYWMAREYFGTASAITRQPHIKRVIGDILDGKAAVGIIPTLRSDDTTYWWTNLMQQGENTPKIFAHIPFIYTGETPRNAPAALAIAKLRPEPSGDDVSLLVFEGDQNLSQHKIQSAFASAKLEATWLNIATLSPASRHHLISVRGFLPVESDGVKAIMETLGSSILSVSFLGAYAVPITLESKNTSAKGTSHVAAKA